MHVQDCFAPAEFFPYGFQVGIAWPMTLVVIRVDTDPVTFQGIARVLDLLQGTFYIGERYRCKQSETFRVVLHTLRTEFIGSPNCRASLRSVVVNHVAHLSQREDRRADAEFIHLLDGSLGRPRPTSASACTCGAGGRSTPPSPRGPAPASPPHPAARRRLGVGDGNPSALG